MAFSRAGVTLASSVLYIAAAGAQERVELGAFAIDRTEVTIARFSEFADATGLETSAEKEDGGHEWGAGWERRPGWTFRTPFGSGPESPEEPAVHVSWGEARQFCALAGGRLPTGAEWGTAAYTEKGPGVANGYREGTVYRYPTGDSPDGANTTAPDAWARHAPVGTTVIGVNGLFDMGANVWEWVEDRRDGEALTAGGSWWYGPEKMLAEAMQWKPVDFYAAYIGFRCAYDTAD